MYNGMTNHGNWYASCNVKGGMAWLTNINTTLYSISGSRNVGLETLTVAFYCGSVALTFPENYRYYWYLARYHIYLLFTVKHYIGVNNNLILQTGLVRTYGYSLSRL